MSLFRKLFGKKDVLRLADPAFGELTYDRGGWTHIPESRAGGFMISVEAPETGPSDAQRLFLERLRQCLPSLVQSAKDFIALDTDDKIDVGCLVIYSLGIGTDAEIEAERFVIELTDNDEIEVHRVSFEAGKPTLYSCDD